MSGALHVHDAEYLIEQRIEALRRLSWEEASLLPRCAEEQVVVGGVACALTTYRQSGVLPNPGSVLVTVQLARARCFGALSDHLQEGLVFEPGTPARRAATAELLESGG